MNITPKFGTAGAGELFYTKGYKTSQEAPAFLASLGLTAFEYQCGRGVRIGDEKAEILGGNAKKHNIALSIHAPYYISLTTDDPQKKENNLRYLRESAHAATKMGASRIVFHSGSVNKKSDRRDAFKTAYDALEYIIDTLNSEGYQHLTFCPETMGKLNQLGNLEEVLEFCKISDNILPCIDFGHLNSRLQGSIVTIEDYERIFDKISENIGEEKARIIHCHFSKIEYGPGGEKKHLTFEDKVFGPPFEPFVELLATKKYAPTIICESAGTQAEDAKSMWEAYKNYC